MGGYMRPDRMGVVAFLCVLTGHAWASGEGVVEAVGEAQVRGGDRVAAKKVAVADGLKKCIEQVVGISIKSDFSSELQETVRNNQNEFNAKVTDSLVQKSEGFIQKYDVLEENIEGDVLKVKVRAHVFESKIKAEVKKLADLIAAAGNPKIMLAIQDVHTSGEDSQVDNDSVLAAYLEKELLARGFEVRGKGVAKKVTAGTEDGYDQWMQDTSAVASAARDAGADIIIFGRVKITNKGVIEDPGALSALKGQTRIEISSVIRGANSANGEVFSSEPVQMLSIGTTVERAAHRAFRGRGANLVKRTFDSLFEDLKQSFRKTAEQGQSFVIVLKGVRSFRKQGRKFMHLLSGLDGVSNVQQKSFQGGVLTLDLACKCSANDLQERVFGASEAYNPLENLDVESVSGKRLSFKL